MARNSARFHQGNKAGSLRIKRHGLDANSSSITIKKDNDSEIWLTEVNKNIHTHTLMMLERKHAF